MAGFELTWIDKHAEVGPVFRIHRPGWDDVYTREIPGRRVLRLRTVNAPPIEYVEPAVEAFRVLAEAWGAPIVYLIDPDVRRPPAARFLYEWSRRAYQDGSVDQSYMVMTNRVTRALGGLVCRMFVAGGMPIEAVVPGELDERLARLDLSCGRPDFACASGSTALALRRGLADDAFGQILLRAIRRLSGGGRDEQPRP